MVLTNQFKVVATTKTTYRFFKDLKCGDVIEVTCVVSQNTMGGSSCGGMAAAQYVHCKRISDGLQNTLSFSDIQRIEIRGFAFENI